MEMNVTKVELFYYVQLRKQAGDSVQNLAKNINVNYSLLYDIEAGRRSLNHDTFNKILNYYNATYNFDQNLYNEAYDLTIELFKNGETMKFIEEMTKEDFERYLKNSILNFAEENIKSTNWKKEDAYDKSVVVFNELLPDGIETKDHYFFNIIVNNEQAGILWLYFNENKKTVFIYDINIKASFQNQGVGTKVLQEAEEFAKEKKAIALELHVFGHNHRAYNFYKKLHFYETSIQMRKDI